MIDLSEYLEHFRARVLQDALNEASWVYWLRRAEAFAAVGNAACDEAAAACRNHARFLVDNPVTSEAEVVVAIREAA